MGIDEIRDALGALLVHIIFFMPSFGAVGTRGSFHVLKKFNGRPCDWNMTFVKMGEYASMP